jgi:polysaccharide transporter, PST family
VRHRILSNAASLTLIQVANYITPLIVLVYLARVLGTEIYGVLAFTQAIIIISSILTDFGYSLSATDKISKNRDRINFVSTIIGGIYLFKLALFICCAIVIIAFANFSQIYHEHKTLLLLTLIPIFAQTFYPLWFFQGIEKMNLLAFFSIVIKVAYVFLVIYFVKAPEDYILVPLLSGLAYGVGVCMSIAMIYRLGYKITIPNKKRLLYCVNFSRNFFVSRVAVMVYMNSSVLILGLVANSSIVAIYSIAEQLYKAMQSAISPLSAAVYPFMSKEKDIRLMIKLIYYCVFFVILGAIFGYFVSPFLISYFFDESWASSLSLLNVFFIAIVFHAGAVMTGYPLAAALGRIDVANSSVVVGAFIYCIGIIMLFEFGEITPLMLAALMIVSEISVLAQRTFTLMPLAIKKIQNG